MLFRTVCKQGSCVVISWQPSSSLLSLELLLCLSTFTSLMSFWVTQWNCFAECFCIWICLVSLRDSGKLFLARRACSWYFFPAYDVMWQVMCRSCHGWLPFDLLVKVVCTVFLWCKVSLAPLYLLVTLWLYILSSVHFKNQNIFMCLASFFWDSLGISGCWASTESIATCQYEEWIWTSCQSSHLITMQCA